VRPTAPASSLADSTLLELAAKGEFILAGGSGNGYRLAELMAASNPSGWSGVIKIKPPPTRPSVTPCPTPTPDNPRPPRRPRRRRSSN